MRDKIYALVFVAAVVGVSFLRPQVNASDEAQKYVAAVRDNMRAAYQESAIKADSSPTEVEFHRWQSERILDALSDAGKVISEGNHKVYQGGWSAEKARLRSQDLARQF